MREGCQTVRGVKVLKSHRITLVAYLLASGLPFLFGGNHYAAFISSQAQLFLLSLFAYQVCGKEYRTRSALYAITAYNGYILLTDWMFSYVSYLQWSLEILFFSFVALFQTMKNYNLKGDAYNDKNIMLVFYKPKTSMEYLFTMFGATASSMSVICKDKWYLFRRKKTTLQVKKVIHRKLCDYVLIDTGIQISENHCNELDKLVGSKARDIKSLCFRFKCISTFKNFLDGLGSTWRVSLLDRIPSIYLYKRINNDD